MKNKASADINLCHQCCPWWVTLSIRPMRVAYTWPLFNVVLEIREMKQTCRRTYRHADRNTSRLYVGWSMGIADSSIVRERQEAQLSPSDRAMRLVSNNLASYHATVQRLLIQLKGKYSLESTDPRESEIRAHLRPQFSVEWVYLRMYYLFIMHQVICLFVNILFVLEKITGLWRFWTVTSTPG